MTIQDRSSLLLSVLTVLIALVVAPAVYADDDDDDGGSSGSSCVVKFVCGEVEDVEGGEEDAARAVFGSYRTAINVANTGGRTVTYSKKLLTTTPCDPEVGPPATFETPGEATDPILGSLGSMLAFDIDCREIFGEFEACGPLAEGFLVLQSSGPLSVTAVYTAGQAEGDGVSSVDVEHLTCGAGGGGGDDDDDDGGDGDDDD